MAAGTSAGQAYASISPGALVVPVDWVTITPAATVFPIPYRAIRCKGAGTVTVTTPGAAGRVMNFNDGETRYGMFLAITASAGPTVIEAGL